MALTSATILLTKVGTAFQATIQRNSTTAPVDATSGAPNRITLPFTTSPSVGAPAVVKTITAASNATPIVLTLDSITNLADGDLVRVSGVNGNTNANGTFRITSTSGSNTTLVGSAGNAAFSTSANARLVKVPNAKTIHEALAAICDALLNDYATNG